MKYSKTDDGRWMLSSGGYFGFGATKQEALEDYRYHLQEDGLA